MIVRMGRIVPRRQASAFVLPAGKVSSVIGRARRVITAKTVQRNAYAGMEPLVTLLPVLVSAPRDSKATIVNRDAIRSLTEVGVRISVLATWTMH